MSGYCVIRLSDISLPFYFQFSSSSSSPPWIGLIKSLIFQEKLYVFVLRVSESASIWFLIKIYHENFCQVSIAILQSRKGGGESDLNHNREPEFMSGRTTFKQTRKQIRASGSTVYRSIEMR